MARAISIEKKKDKVKSILYGIKAMTGKEVNIQKQFGIGTAYSSALNNSGLYEIKNGKINWVHPNGINDEMLEKIIAEAMSVGRRHNALVAQRMQEENSVSHSSIESKDKEEDKDDNVLKRLERLEEMIGKLLERNTERKWWRK